jgi:hypothetical protein
LFQKPIHYYNSFYDFSSMNGCDGAQPGAYAAWLSSNSGQAPHEFDHPYEYSTPKLTCPSGAKTYNSGAKVVETLKDMQCNEDKMKQLVCTPSKLVIQN